MKWSAPLAKELLLSFLLHICGLSIFPLIKLVEKQPLYPMSVYQVSIQSIPTPQSVTQLTGEKEKKSPPKEKAKTSPQKTGLPQKKGPISTEGGEFKYSWYLEIILSKIAENWRNPYEGEGGKISAVVYFIIHRSGEIDKIRLEKSSRNYYYDQAALRAVQTTKNLPPLPQEFDRPYLGVYFEFEYVQ